MLRVEPEFRLFLLILFVLLWDTSLSATSKLIANGQFGISVGNDISSNVVFVFHVVDSDLGDRISSSDAVRTREVTLALTAYFPDTFSDDETGMMDIQGHRLRTLQDYLDGRAPYVTVSTDPRAEIPYGTRVLIPDLDNHFGVKDGIRFEARDTGPHLGAAGLSRLDVCVRSEQDSYDVAVNRNVTALFLLD